MRRNLHNLESTGALGSGARLRCSEVPWFLALENFVCVLHCFLATFAFISDPIPCRKGASEDSKKLARRIKKMIQKNLKRSPEELKKAAGRIPKTKKVMRIQGATASCKNIQNDFLVNQNNASGRFGKRRRKNSKTAREEFENCIGRIEKHSGLVRIFLKIDLLFCSDLISFFFPCVFG